MKAKKVLLHVCILVLAAICIACVGYIAYWERQDVKEEHIRAYNDDYESDITTLLRYASAQAEYIENYSDMDKVLVENKQFGNITPKELAKFYNYKFSYEEDYEWEGYDSVEDFVYANTVAGKLEMAEDALESEDSEYNTNQYNYYKEVYDVFDSYEDCIATLLGSYSRVDENNPLTFTKKIERATEYTNYINDGWDYYISYRIGDKDYVITNVEDESSFEDRRNYQDIYVLEDGKLVLEDEKYLYPDEPLEYLLQADWSEIGSKLTKMIVGVDVSDITFAEYATDVDSTYAYIDLISTITAAPEEEAMVSIRKNYVIFGGIAAGTVILALVLFVILMILAGHKKKGDQAQIFAIDKIWIDIGLIVAISVDAVFFAVLEEVYYNWGFSKLTYGLAFIFALATLEGAILLSESFARRVKTKSLGKTTLLGKLWQLLKKLWKKAKVNARKLYEHLNLTIKVVIVGFIILVWQILTALVWENDAGFLADLLMVCVPIVVVCYLIWRYFSEKEIIQKGAEKISGGEIDYKIVEEMKYATNKNLKESINNIGAGLNDAVEKSIKNERMKTELITNVSHDLKTPLTSIINYVDLLKTDGVDSENAEKYLDVLDQKSQRLKNLTEDLVEASKLNSGVAVLNREKLDIVQLVNQSLAEYDEKFAQKKLQIVKTIQEEPLYVMADGRKTWRLFDNLYNNIFKYAMAGTRVYIDMAKVDGKAVISLKNISESPLNFSADELMERFVRGDVSRTTEGSGLGLSISRSIVERQDGEMKITLDGDLFKVEVMMNIIG